LVDKGPPYLTVTANLNTLFKYPQDIRKAIKKRKLFPTDDEAKKVAYLPIMDVSK
jgi:putative transposase